MSSGVYISGPPVKCSRCGSDHLLFLDEAIDQIDQVYVGEVRCWRCQGEMVFARRPGDPVPAYFNLGSVEYLNERGGGMQLFEMEKIGVFCDSFKPRVQKKRDHEIKLVDVTLRIEPLTAEQASTVGGNGFVKKSLFNLSHGTAVPNLKMVEFDVEVPRQQLHVFAAPDVDQPSFVFDQVDITRIRARMAKALRWSLIFHATFGPVSKQELEGLNGWFTTQRFLTFKEASPSLEFEEGTEADTKSRKTAKPEENNGGPKWEAEGGQVKAPKAAPGGRARGPRRLPAGPVEKKRKGPEVH